jgi:hypothetical protein
VPPTELTVPPEDASSRSNIEHADHAFTQRAQIALGSARERSIIDGG